LQAEAGIRALGVTGGQTCALPISLEEEGSNVLSGVLLNLSVTVGYEHDSCNSPLT